MWLVVKAEVLPDSSDIVLVDVIALRRLYYVREKVFLYSKEVLKFINDFSYIQLILLHVFDSSLAVVEYY